MLKVTLEKKLILSASFIKEEVDLEALERELDDYIHHERIEKTPQEIRHDLMEILEIGKREYAYLLYAYKSMIELDEVLAKAIQEPYISEQNSK